MDNAQHRKPWLSPHGQIQHLRSKGVRFDYIFSENDAEQYLQQNNNYFRLRSYRTGFPKVEEGPRKGQYANLDFFMLVDLSIIDMLLRYEMLPLTLDIEHFAKVELMKSIEEHHEDGYAIVQDFLASYDQARDDGTTTNAIKNEICRGKTSSYVSGLLEKYPYEELPVWVLLELISFGTFVYFYKFCADRYGNRNMQDRFYQLQSVRALRNACAHNNCILNDIGPRTASHRINDCVGRAVRQIGNIGRDQARTKLSNDRIQQITTTLYLHKTIASEGVHSHKSESLQAFTKRMNRNLDHYLGNMQIASTFEYLTKLVNAWFSTDATNQTPS